MMGKRYVHQEGGLYTTGDISELLGVPISTQKEWERCGFLESCQTAGRHRRYTLDGVRRLQQVKKLTHKYRFRERVLEALARGEAADSKLPWEMADEHRKSEADLDRERLLDLAACNAELFAEQRNLAKVLAAAQERYKALVEGSPDIAASVAADGTIGYISPAVRQYGYDPLDVCGRTFAGMLVENRSTVEKAFSRIIAGRDHSLRAEATIGCADGRTVPFDLKIMALGDSTSPSGLIVIARDITERKQMESDLAQVTDLLESKVVERTEELRESNQRLEEELLERQKTEQALRAGEEQYRRIVETAHEGIWIVDADGNTTFVNSQMAEMLGCSPAELIGTTAISHLTVGLPSEDGTAMESAEGRHDAKFRRKNGSEFWGSVSASPFYQSDGEYAGMLRMVSDITERKWSERVLEESRAQFRTIFEGAGVGMALLDRDGTIMLSNPAMQEMLGYSRDELMGTIGGDMMDADDAESARQSLADLFEGKHYRVQVERRFKRKDGSDLWARVTVGLIQYGNGNNSFAVGMMEDVTERIDAIEAIRYLSFHDKLTGLYNRAYFEEELKRLDTELQLPLSVIMGDVNGLKPVNDAFGHTVGDELLVTIGDIIKQSCRKEDIISRWGGDEFVVLLPATTDRAALKICDRIRQACETADCRPIPLSLALGTSTKDRPAKLLDEVLKESEDRMYRHKLVESKSARSSIIGFLEETLAARSYETMEHADRLRDLAVRLGDVLGLAAGEMDELNLLASIHDIGKIAIPDEIVMKPRGLTKEEWEVMKTHPEVGYRIAQSSPELAVIAPAILAHHERWDGTGYPAGLAEGQIPLVARIVALVDSYDAMTNDRPYHKAISQEVAIAELERCRGTQFDPDLVGPFVAILRGVALPLDCSR
jgi:diguanylate cyclase (GGDEF)-like protein/PAS domain S-box-containing protein